LNGGCEARIMAVVKKMLMLLVLVSVSLGVGAQVHHIVGGERGWDPYADLGLWSSARTFRVGDKICKPSLSPSLALSIFHFQKDFLF